MSPGPELIRRKDLLKYIGVAAAGAAIPTAFILGRSSAPGPTPEIPKASPEPTKLPESAPTAVFQPKPTARPTAFIPELVTPTVRPLRPTEAGQLTPTPRLAEKPRPTELPRGKVWETPVSEILERPFLWTGKKLFVVSPKGVPSEINLQDKKSVWEWDNKGYIVAATNLLYLFNSEANRAYALDINSKNEVWKYPLPEILSSASLFGLRFWVAGDYIAFETSGGIAIVDRDKKEKIIPQGKVSYFSENKIVYKKPPQGASSFWTTRVEKPFGEDPEAWQDDDVGAYVVDDKIMIYQKYVRGVPGISAGPTITTTYAREIRNGNTVWSGKFNAAATPTFLSKDILIIQDPEFGAKSLYYYLFSRKDFTDITRLPKELNTPHKFTSWNNWTFAVHPRNGTKAFKDGVFAWENDDILGITYPLGEVDGKLVLAHKEANKTSANPEGAIWLVDANNGKKLPGFPVYFDTLMTEPKVLGNKVVVADGIDGKRFSLSVLDLATRQKSVLLSDLFVQNIEKVDDNLVLAHTGGFGPKLYLFRV